MEPSSAAPSPVRRAVLASALAGTTVALAGVSGPASAAAPPQPCPDNALPTTGRALVSAGPGKKWSIEGEAQRFRGNTVVYPIPQDSAFWHAQHMAQELVAQSRFVHHFTLLPRTSMHMTLFDGVSQGTNRSTPAWPAYVPRDAPLDVATRMILERLLRHNVRLPRRVVMKVVGVKDMVSDGAAPSVLLAGVDDATEQALRAARARLQEVTGIRATGFDTYRFHSTLGYRLVAARTQETADLRRLQGSIRRLFAGAAGTVELEPAAFCVFDDMLAFPQVAVL